MYKSNTEKAYNLENNQCTYMSSDKHMNTNILYKVKF